MGKLVILKLYSNEINLIMVTITLKTEIFIFFEKY